MIKYLLFSFLLQSSMQVFLAIPNIEFISTNFYDHDKNYNLKIIRNEIKKCGNVESLNLDSMNLYTIKSNIIQSQHVQHISLYNNNLEDIYTILDHVPYLSCLNLSRNEINVYNDNIIRHSHLEILDLSYQKISEARDLKTETNDVYKYMKFNSIGISLPNLQYLDLSGNDISTLLWDFNLSFPKLIQLDLTNINARILELEFFDKIPKSLRVLHLENNNLHNLTLQNMAEVTALYLDSNPNLQTINIVSKRLKILSLSNCENIGYGTFDTPYLEQLDLSMNNLKSVSNISFEIFPSLRMLLLDYNKLSQIPSLNALQQLNDLSMNFNMIKNIPSASFASFPSLKKLSLKGNKIDRIERDSFFGLSNLEYLNLSDNKLKGLPYDWATSLINLQYLNANSNQFANILDLAINSNIVSLKHLSVKNNLITKISTLELAHLPNATTVYVA
ncbi:toll-like receptor 3 [Camponotus floridanus]|uniref:toll-like receptor 3 n=1 Tax=Camponotus floridanus TaxID=104421 RepID=UPI000971632B|nr:toll-like receptor 3 [Camponotus floridanus]